MLVGVIVAPIVVLVYLIGFRILMELYMVLFRMANDLATLAGRPTDDQAQGTLESASSASMTAPMTVPDPTCPSCGTKAPESGKFCVSCGTALA